MPNSRTHAARIALLLAPILGLSCASALWVTDGEKTEGVPFYVKRAVYQQTTLYDVRWWRLVLTTTNLEPKAGKETAMPAWEKVVAQDEASRDLVAEFQTAALSEVGPTKADELRNRFKHLKPFDTETWPDSKSNPVGNWIEKVVVVDYSKPYYLNAPLPWFGSSKADVTLNSDGTLSKGSAEVTSEPEKLASFVPLKEFLASELITEKESPKAVGKGRRTVPVRQRLRLTIKEEGYRYTLVRFHKAPKDSIMPVRGKIVFDDKANWTRSLLTASTGDDEGKKLPKGQGISFSGSVTLPSKEETKPQPK